MPKEAKRIDELEAQVQQLKDALGLLMRSDVVGLTAGLRATTGDKDSAQKEFKKFIEIHNLIRAKFEMDAVEVNEK